MGNPVRQPLAEEQGRIRSWDDPETRDCRLRVVNNSDLVVDVLWVPPSSDEASYRILQPGQLHLQGARLLTSGIFGVLCRTFGPELRRLLWRGVRAGISGASLVM